MSKRKHEQSEAGQSSADDKGFQDRLLGMLEWLADKDPVRAAKLIGEYLDELASELGGAMEPKTSKA